VKDSPAHKPLSIVHLVAANRGSAFMVEQLVGLRNRGHGVSAIIGGQGRLEQHLASCEIPHHVVDLDLGWELKHCCALFPKIYRLTRLLLRQRCDVVHYHLFCSSILGRLAAWIADVPIRVRMLEGPIYLEAPASRELDLLTGWMDSFLIASSEYVSRLCVDNGTSSERIGLIYYGADTHRFHPARADRSAKREEIKHEFGIDTSAPLVGLVAYFYAPFPVTEFVPTYMHGRSTKNHEMLLEAVPLVIASIPNARFLLVGDGWDGDGDGYLQSLKLRVREQDLDGTVMFTGFQNDIPEVLSAMDVCVQCSAMENLGGTIESLLMARPLIVTRVGGMVEAVQHGVTGLVVEPDQPKVLAEAITHLLKNPEYATHLAENGRRLMLERFTLDCTVDSLESLYYQLAGVGLKSGYRVPVILLRALIAPFIICRVAWIMCRVEIRNLMLHSASRFKRQCYLLIKRISDFVIALGLAIVTGPIWLIIVLLRALEGRSPTVTVTVEGQFNKPFRARTFGSLHPSSLFKATQSTPASRKLGSESLVAHGNLWWLPLLWHVLTGDMSIVGKRLTVCDEKLELKRAYDIRDPKPGITGWSQLNFSKATSVAELNAMDQLYMGTSNFWLDVKLMAKALSHFLSRKM
jgi:glycosyltransferase involved in cell wall biosynthesis/lipopolysaccharide/colanic/teichoic acid biosynthesis glycosyltransferase